MTSRQLPGEPVGLLVWSAATVGIAAWAAHLMLLASITEFTCTRPGYEWVMHAGTVMTVLVTLAGVGALGRVARHEPDGQRRFVARFGLIIGALSAVLILLEGAYAVALSPCA